MANAEYIDINEIDSAALELIRYADSIQGNQRLSDNQKLALLEAIESKINQILSYEFATTNETKVTTERRTTKSIVATPRKGVRQTVSKERFDGAKVMSKGSKGNIS